MTNANDRRNVNDRGWDSNTGGGAGGSMADCRYVHQWCLNFEIDNLEIGKAIDNSFPIAQCTGALANPPFHTIGAPEIIQDGIGLAPRAIRLHRLTVSFEAIGFVPAVDPMTLFVSLSSDPAPGPPATVIEASGPVAVPMSGAAVSIDFTAAAVVPGGDVWGLIVSGFTALGVVPPGASVQMRFALEWSDCVNGLNPSVLAAFAVAAGSNSLVPLTAVPTRLDLSPGGVSENMTIDDVANEIEVLEGGIYTINTNVTITDRTVPPPGFGGSDCGVIIKSSLGAFPLGAALVTVPEFAHTGPGKAFSSPASTGSSFRFAAGTKVWAEVIGPGHVGSTYDLQGFLTLTGTAT